MRCICIQKILGLMTAAALAACQNPTAGTGGAIAPVSACKIFTAVLGTGQDAGKPQIGVHSDPAWADPSQSALAVSLGLIDRSAEARYIFDASPDMKHQLYWLDQLDDGRGFALDGIFLTHGHMGHYLGLAHLGREAMGLLCRIAENIRKRLGIAFLALRRPGCDIFQRRRIAGP